MLLEHDKILVTGAAGFIGFHLALALLKQNIFVTGVDNINDYYDQALKESRLAILKKHNNFHYINSDIENYNHLISQENFKDFTYIVHLAAQAGVRYSIEKPFSYGHSNLIGHLSILEIARQQINLKHLLYASSSSVYGNSMDSPFHEDQKLDEPISLYAATKKSNELMSYSYSHLYKIPTTGMRFFTVYGPWGRPDMAYFKFTQKILSNEEIDVYNEGQLKRDFTYIDDIINGILSLMEKTKFDNQTPHRVINIGNNNPVSLMDFIVTLENIIGKEAKKNYLQMQPGDVLSTCADISKIQSICDYKPEHNLKSGLKKFFQWYQKYYHKC